MITYLEPDILECEVKWALETITTNKASGGDGIPVELFQILKGDAVKMLHSMCQQTQQWPQDWKRLVLIPIPKKGNAKESSNYSKKLEKGTLPNSFYEATIILIPKNRQRKTTKKEHYKDNICDKHRCNNR